MRRPRHSIAWLMFAVAVIAADCALLRFPGGRDDLSQIRAVGLILMSNILAIGLFRILTGHGERGRFLVRFEVSCLLVTLSYASCPYIRFFRPFCAPLDHVVGSFSVLLMHSFYRTLYGIERGDPSGRWVLFAILIATPAMLLAILLSVIAFLGALVARRKA